MKQLKACLSLLFLSIILWLPLTSASAQEGQAQGPVYVVQPGDTLSNIAFRFGVSVEDLIDANGISNPNQLRVDDRLVIPGLEGVQGVLMTETVPFGENLRSLGRRHRMPRDLLARLNRLVSPTELYAGSPIILPLDETGAPGHGRTYLRPTQSFLELAALEGANAWTLVQLNQLDGQSNAIPGDVLFTPAQVDQEPGALPPGISSMQIGPTPLVQGKTALIRVQANSDLSLDGELKITDLRSGVERTSQLHFYPVGESEYVALQGIHAMSEPGLYPLTLQVISQDGQRLAFTQKVSIADGGYIYDLPLSVPKDTLDPAVTGPEDELWRSLGVEATPERMWQGLFQSPSQYPDCWTSVFGSRRSYNGSPYNYFHTGLDFCGGTGAEITAPAPGIVVFAGPLQVRGNATVINHGWGVYTAYMHQSEIMVKVGDRVEAGQVIGKVGGTGRATGAHLHYEVWVGGIQVDPVEWMEHVYP